MPDVSTLVPPSDPEAERWVLGSVLLQPDQLFELTGVVSAGHFYVEAHRRLFETLEAMHNARDRIDVGLVVRRLEADGNLQHVGGVAFLAELADGIPTTRHAAHYASIVRQKSQLRGLADLGHDLVRRAYEAGADPDNLLGDAARDLAAIPCGSGSDEPQTAHAAVVEALVRIDAIHQRGAAAGVMTGLADFDRELGGLFPSELTILAARPSIGKSALAGGIAAYVAQRHLVYVVSLEMSTQEWMQRALCAAADVDSRRIRNGSLTKADTAALAAAAEPVGKLNLRIDDRPEQRIIDIRRRALRLKRDGLKLLVLDYLGLILPEDRRIARHEQVGAMSRNLKLLAKELEIPVLVLCQLNRAAEEKADAMPQLSHLRESGSIEQDADVVAFLHAPDATNEGYRELIVRKNRNGPIGKFGLTWDARRLTFECREAPERSASPRAIRSRRSSSAHVASANPYASDFDDFGGN